MVDFTQQGIAITGPYLLQKGDDNSKKIEEAGQLLKSGCKQLSQLIAWMWLDENIAQVDEAQGKLLKKLFDAILKYQAFKKNQAGSDSIAKILKGDNEGAVKELEGDNDLKLRGLFPEVPSLKLLDVYSELVPPSPYNQYVFDSKYLENFYSLVATDIFNGTVFYDFFGTNNPKKESKFIVVIPYPPKPALSDFTVSAEELKAWAKNDSSYVPPHMNPYIPINGSS